MDERAFATAALELNHAAGRANGRPFVVLHGPNEPWRQLAGRPAEPEPQRVFEAIRPFLERLSP